MAGNNVQVRLPDGVQLALPEWMLDEQACQDIRESNSRCIAIDDVVHLRRLLSAQPLLQRARAAVMVETISPENTDAPDQTTTTSSASTGRRRTGSAARAAGTMHRAS